MKIHNQTLLFFFLEKIVFNQKISVKNNRNTNADIPMLLILLGSFPNTFFSLCMHKRCSLFFFQLFFFSFDLTFYRVKKKKKKRKNDYIVFFSSLFFRKWPKRRFTILPNVMKHIWKISNAYFVWSMEMYLCFSFLHTHFESTIISTAKSK